MDHEAASLDAASEARYGCSASSMQRGGISLLNQCLTVAARAAVAELVSCNCELYPIFCQHVRRRHKLVIQRLRDRGNRR